MHKVICSAKTKAKFFYSGNRIYKRLILFVALILVIVGGVIAQETVMMANYGPSAPTREGDNDFMQVLFFYVPENVTEELYLRLFDADCGGQHDLRFGMYDTQTRFRFYGGPGAVSTPGATDPTPDKTGLYAGNLIAEDTYGDNIFRDNKWHNLATFTADKGEKIDGFYVFKLVVECLEGDDCNTFDVFLSDDPRHNEKVKDAQVTNYSPTVHLPRMGIYAEMRFYVPDSVEKIFTYNFDVAGANVGVETAFRSALPVKSSGQDNWMMTEIEIEPIERNRLNAIKFIGGGEMPNDATFYVTDEDSTALPILMPIYIWQPNNRPIPKINLRTLSDCYTVVFDALRSIDKDGDPMKFYWDFGDGHKATGERVTHKYAKYDTYNAQLIISDQSGQVGNSTLKKFEVFVNEPPVAVAGENMKGVPGQVFHFDGSKSSDRDSKLKRYVWDFKDGTKGEGAKISHKYTKSDIYYVTLRVEDDSDSPCNFDVDEIRVWVNAPPIVDAGEDMIISPKETVELHGGRSYDSDGEIIDFSWDMGDGNSKNGLIINHAYDKPGKYKVILTVTDDSEVENSTDSDHLFIRVNDRPVAIAGDDRRVAAGEKVYFNGSKSYDRDGKIIEYHWDFGDGHTTKGMKTNHPYEKPGVYTVTLRVTDDSGTSSSQATDQLTVVVNYPPVADAGKDVLLTSSVVDFDGTKSSDRDGEITAYRWDFGDKSYSKEAKPSHVYKNPGTYTVKLTVTDDSKTSSDKDSDEMTVIINEAPIANSGKNQFAATGQVLEFDGSGSIDRDGEIVEYMWNFGDGKTATGQKVSHSYSKQGSYSVWLKVVDNTRHKKAIDFDEAIVRVNAAPIAEAGRDIYAAPGQMITLDGGLSFDPDGKIDSYQWNFSDNTNESAKKQVKRKFDTPGIYSASLTVADDSRMSNSIATDKINIYINNRPIAKPGDNIFTNETTVRFDGTQSADPDGDPLSFVWDFGDGSAKEQGVVVVHTYKDGGVYPVMLTVNDGKELKNSSHTASMTVTIDRPPVADAGGNKTICAGDVVLFDGSNSNDPEGGLLKYKWDFGDGTTAEGMNPSKVYKTGGVYQVSLFVKDDSNIPENTDIDNIVVRVGEAPVAEAGPDQVVHANMVVEFDGSASKDLDGVVNSFTWDFGDGIVGTGATPTHIYETPGKYRVLLKIVGDKIGHCSNTSKDEMYVTVLDAPSADFKYERYVPVNTEVEFDASGVETEDFEIVSWKWDFGDGNTGEGVTTTHTYTKYGKYFITLTVKTDEKTGGVTTVKKDFIVVNQAPVANAGSNVSGGVGQIIVFDGQQSKDIDGAIRSYEWDFGDGNNGSGAKIRHQYRESGVYEVTLTVTDNTELTNNKDVAKITATINQAPAPGIDAPDWVCANTQVSFASNEAPDKEGGIVTIEWDFGDGTKGTGQEASHTYSKPGRYNVTLSIKDNSLAENSIKTFTKTVNVNQPPVAFAGKDRTVCPGQVVVFDAVKSHDYDGTIETYEWDFGDGEKSGEKKTTHKFDEPGSYDVRLTVTDNSGTSCGIVKDIVKITVNSAPVADAGDDLTGFTGGAHDAIVFDGTKSYDPDGEPLRYYWHFGDGTKANGPVVMHTYTKAGTYTAKLKVVDSSGTKCSEGWDEIKVEIKRRD